MNTIFGQIIKTDKIKKGDIVCHLNNWNQKMYFFFRVSDEDEKEQIGFYLKLTENNEELKELSF